MKKSFLLIFVLGIIFAIGVPNSQATIITLTDLNSTAEVDITDGNGMYSWVVDGIPMLSQQWFWYRIGNTGPESPINTIGAPTYSTLGSRILDTVYSNASISIDILYTLTGGTLGSKTSDIAETIRIINNGTSTINLSFFQYTDFDLGGYSNNSVSDDMVERRNANTFGQWDQYYASTETITTPVPSHYEANYWPNTLISLYNGSPTTLGDIANAGPGDVTWTWQWDITLAPRGTQGSAFIISKDKHIGPPPVPEPGTLILLGSGLLGIVVYGKVKISRKKK